jgi:hypothetical protein
MLHNPLHVSLPLHDVHLLWNFKKSSGATSQLVDNEMMLETAESPVHTQHISSVMLKPDYIQEVCTQLPMQVVRINSNLRHVKSWELSSPCL